MLRFKWLSVLVFYAEEQKGPFLHIVITHLILFFNLSLLGLGLNFGFVVCHRLRFIRILMVRFTWSQFHVSFWMHLMAFFNLVLRVWKAAPTGWSMDQIFCHNRGHSEFQTEHDFLNVNTFCDVVTNKCTILNFT